MPTRLWGKVQRARYDRFPKDVARGELRALCDPYFRIGIFATPYVSRPFLSHARSVRFRPARIARDPRTGRRCRFRPGTRLISSRARGCASALIASIEARSRRSGTRVDLAYVAEVAYSVLGDDASAAPASSPASCGALEQLQRKPHCAGIGGGSRGWLRAGHGREKYHDPMNHDTVTVRCDRMGILYR